MRLRGDERRTVIKQILTADSPVFRHLLDELKHNELLMDDFSPRIVDVFLGFLEQRTLGVIRKTEFRELHKLSVVFKVQWLREGCYAWMRRLFEHELKSFTEKSFLFEECSYIFKKWELKTMMDELVSHLILSNNSHFIAKYLSDIEKLETFQIDVLLKIGGSATEPFLSGLLSNLAGKTDLGNNVKYLLQHLNMALCSEINKELYLQVVDAISNLPEISADDLRFTLKMTSHTTRLLDLRIAKRKLQMSGPLMVGLDTKEYKELLEISKTINDILFAIVEKRVTSMLIVIDQLLFAFTENLPNPEDIKTWLKSVDNLSKERKLQKVSKQHLDDIISALNYSHLEQADDLTTLLTDIRSNKNLATDHETVQIDCVVTVSAEKVFRHLYHFQHPAIRSCNQEGMCGFMLEGSLKNDDNHLMRLCTDEEDYKETGIHFHDVVMAGDMQWYSVRYGHTAYDKEICAPGRFNWEKRWLPFITDWKLRNDCVAYDISDFLVAKQD